MIQSQSPLHHFIRGLRAYVRGAQWLWRHPRYLFLSLAVPMLLGVLLAAGGMMAFVHYDEAILQALMFAQPESWWGITLFYVVKAALVVVLMVMILSFSMLAVNIIAAPLYEVVSVAVERDLTGSPVREISLWQSLRLVKEELKKVLVIIAISIALFVIPGIGVLSIFATAFMIGWDFYDYRAVRLGLTFAQRRKAVGGDFWAILGFGLWLVIPFASFITFPLAAAGGTILHLESSGRK